VIKVALVALATLSACGPAIDCSVVAPAGAYRVTMDARSGDCEPHLFSDVVIGDPNATPWLSGPFQAAPGSCEHIAEYLPDDPAGAVPFTHLVLEAVDENGDEFIGRLTVQMRLGNVDMCSAEYDVRYARPGLPGAGPAHDAPTAS